MQTKMNKKELPKYLYDYRNMTHGEFKLAILKVIGENDVFYDVINEYGVKTTVTKSHVDNFDLSPTGDHYVIYSERNDELARKILCEDEVKYIQNIIMETFDILNKRIEHENMLLDVMRNNEVVVYGAKDGNLTDLHEDREDENHPKTCEYSSCYEESEEEEETCR